MVNFLFSLFERSDKREETRQAFLEQSGRKGLGLEPSLKENKKCTLFFFLRIYTKMEKKVYKTLLRKPQFFIYGKRSIVLLY